MSFPCSRAICHALSPFSTLAKLTQHVKDVHQAEIRLAGGLKVPRGTNRSFSCPRPHSEPHFSRTPNAFHKHWKICILTEPLHPLFPSPLVHSPSPSPQPDTPPLPTQDQEEEEENAHLGDGEGFGYGMDEGEGEGETEGGGGEGVGEIASGSSSSGTRKGKEREVVDGREGSGGEDWNLSEDGGVGAACGMDGVVGEVSSDDGSTASVPRDDEAGIGCFRKLDVEGLVAFWKGESLASTTNLHAASLAINMRIGLVVSTHEDPYRGGVAPSGL